MPFFFETTSWFVQQTPRSVDPCSHCKGSRRPSITRFGAMEGEGATASHRTAPKNVEEPRTATVTQHRITLYRSRDNRWENKNLNNTSRATHRFSSPISRLHPPFITPSSPPSSTRTSTSTMATVSTLCNLSVQLHTQEAHERDFSLRGQSPDASVALFSALKHVKLTRFLLQLV